MLALLFDPVVTGVLGAILGVLLHSFVVSRQRGVQEHETPRVAERVAYLERQLRELYWPLYVGLVRDEAVSELQQRRSELPEQEQRKIQRTVEDEILLPSHLERVDLLREKLHLFEGAELPESFTDYIRHVSVLQVMRTDANAFSPSDVGTTWPEAFANEVRERTHELSKEYKALLRQIQYP